ncbi:MAG: methionine aminotransferase [Phycisphaerales bacterium]
MAVSSRLSSFGTTIFAEMSRLAIVHGAVNLGQGFPDFDGPDWLKDAASRALRDHPNQYAPTGGLPALTTAIADRWALRTGMHPDPATEVTVTCGCTEGIAAAMIGLLNPGDEVVVFEPYYDSYRACIAMADGVPRYVPLRAPGFVFDPDEFRAAFSGRTRAVLINTPHNPTGRVLTREELSLIAELCIEHDCIAIADEVYEELVFDGREHVSIATLPGMADRTITLSSLGKTFSVTGWKIGWAVASPELTRAVRAAHQFLTFAIATPLQHAAAAALRAPDSYFTELRVQYTQKRDLLCDALAGLGFGLTRPEGTYFVLADHTSFGFERDTDFCKHLIEKVGVAAIPPSFFYEQRDLGAPLVRFAFCKRDETLRDAILRLAKLRVK